MKVVRLFSVLFAVLFLLGGLLLLNRAMPATAVENSIIYVNHAATGLNDGSSWDDAHINLNDALTAATSGDEIWVARGVYLPGNLVTHTFQISPGIAVYGGFAGTETVRDQRDWQANLTILSGDIDNNDTKDARGVILRTEDISGQNAYHVVLFDMREITHTAMIDTTTLDGFIITGGQANENNFPHFWGGGALCLTNQNLDEAEIALGLGACSPRLANITFQGNYALASGGAMYSHGRGNASSPTYENVTFAYNTTSSESIDDGGGAVYNNAIDGVSSPSFTNVTFLGNVGYQGGAVHNNGSSLIGVSSPTFTNVRFLGNSASYRGGALFNDGSFAGSANGVLTNVLFSGNSAEENGGAVFSKANGSGSRADIQFINATFSRNQGALGGAVYSEGSDLITGPRFYNSILWDNQATEGFSHQIYNWDGTVTIGHSLVQGGWNGDGVYKEGVGETNNAGGNIAGNPRFENALGLDGIAGTLDDDLRLQANSPAIDVGDNSRNSTMQDLAGNLRLIDGNDDGSIIIDMGPYEAPTRPVPVGEKIYLPMITR